MERLAELGEGTEHAFRAANEVQIIGNSHTYHSRDVLRAAAIESLHGEVKEERSQGIALLNPLLRHVGVHMLAVVHD
jgi:hypothetical protein